jgi:hypothetical protein
MHSLEMENWTITAAISNKVFVDHYIYCFLMADNLNGDGSFHAMSLTYHN